MAKGLHCILFVELKWHTNEQVQWLGTMNLYIYLHKAGIDIRRQNVTSTEVRFWRRFPRRKS